MGQKDGELMPFDLLVEILSRLPGKPLMRFKRVSKCWFNLITDPVFAELHNTRSSNKGGGGVFVAPTWTDKCLMCVIDMKKEPLQRVTVLEPSLPYDNKSTTNIVNGLICFYDEYYERRLLYLYNLTTRESISLPSPQFEGHSRPSPEQLSRSNAIPRPSVDQFSRKCLLGFDPIDKEYKVLHFFVQGHNKVKCQVLTIGGRKMVWRTLDVSHVEGSKEIRSKGGFYEDGYLYWIRQNVMILFDVRHETFKSIFLPVDQLPLRMRITLVKVEDGLILVEVDWHFKRSSSVEIIWWRLQEWRASGELQWSRNATVFEHRSLMGDCFNHSGQMFSVRSPKSDSSIIDYFDLVTGKHQEFEVNNPRGILTCVSCFRATEVIDNIMPLRNALRVPEYS